jgi:hypothetical protein
MKTTVISLFMLLLIVSLAAVTESVDFNNASDLNTYFNLGSFDDVTNSSIGGINNSGAVQFPLFSSSLDTRTVTYKNGISLNQLDEPVTISAYIYSQANGGYAGLGVSSLPTNTSNSICQITNTPAFGMEFYSSGAHLFSNFQQRFFSYYPDIPLSWYKVVLTITPRTGHVYDLKFKLYRTDANGSFLSISQQGSYSFTNTTIGNVDGKVYPYLTICWHRVKYMDNFSVDYPVGPVITPTPETDPVTLSGGSSLPVTNDVVEAYLCTFSGLSDLQVPILADQRAYAYYGGVWNEGDYALWPGYAGWLDVPFGAKGDIPVVVVEPDATLPVTMSSFTATATSQNLVNLQWVTESESNILGFNVYRSDDAEFAHALKLNAAFIEGTNTSSQQTYHFSDSEFEPGSIYYYWVESTEMNNNSSFYGPVSVLTGTQGEDVPPSPVDGVTGIVNVFPNPFSPGTDIAYKLRDTANVTLVIYNQKGQLIRSLVDSNKDSGLHKISWDGKDSKGNFCANGVYIARMQADGVNSFYKMTLVK